MPSLCFGFQSAIGRAEPRARKGGRCFPLRTEDEQRTVDGPTKSVELGILRLGLYRHRFLGALATTKVPIGIGYSSWDSVILTTLCFPDFHFGGLIGIDGMPSVKGYGDTHMLYR